MLILFILLIASAAPAAYLLSALLTRRFAKRAIPRWIHVPWWIVSLTSVIVLYRRSNSVPFSIENIEFVVALTVLNAWMFCSRWMR